MRNKKIFKFVILSLILVIILTFVLLLYNYNNNFKIDSSVILDTNPSIKLNLNKKNKVISFKGLNHEGEKILKEENLKNSTLNKAINIIYNTLLKEGYITLNDNSILVTIDNSNLDKSRKLQDEITNILSNLDEENEINLSVITQNYVSQKEINSLADEYGITESKALLINKIIKANPNFVFKDLVSLTMNELNLLIDSNNINKVDVDVSGSASQKKYIGYDEALNISLNHLNINKEDINYLEIDMDFEKGIMLYEVEFIYNFSKHEYDINAKTGEIIKNKNYKDYDVDNVSINNQDSNYISKEKVLEIVLNDSNVTSYKNLEIDFDFEKGIYVYEIEFEYNKVEYEYVVDAKTGAILYSEKEID